MSTVYPKIDNNIEVEVEVDNITTILTFELIDKIIFRSDMYHVYMNQTNYLETYILFFCCDLVKNELTEPNDDLNEKLINFYNGLRGEYIWS